MTRRKPRALILTGPNRRRWQVSVSRGTYRLVQGVAIARGTTMVDVLEQACAGVGVEADACADVVGGCGGFCPDCIAEEAEGGE